MYTSQDHTFVICAYKDSPYLQACMESLAGQTQRSRIILVTSTPSRAIEAACEHFGIPMHINTTAHHGIAGDWNFGVACAHSALVTIAHQDDVYKPRYTADMLQALNRAKAHEPLLYFTNYAELRNGAEQAQNRLLAIKRCMLTPFLSPLLSRMRWVRKLVLGSGNPICCPSVTLIQSTCEKLGRNEFFNAEFGSNLDWQTWLVIAKLPGMFVYNPTIEMCHRIHEGSETSRLIENQTRDAEDLAMLGSFWPRPIARMLHVLYKHGQDSNRS